LYILNLSLFDSRREDIRVQFGLWDRLPYLNISWQPTFSLCKLRDNIKAQALTAFFRNIYSLQFVTNIAVCLNLTPCSLVEPCQCFRGNWWFYLLWWGQRVLLKIFTSHSTTLYGVISYKTKIFIVWTWEPQNTHYVLFIQPCDVQDHRNVMRS
jgi:hypothetical protein